MAEKEAVTKQAVGQQVAVVELELNTANDVLSFLAKQQWDVVNPLISKIHQELKVKPPYQRK